MWVAIEKDRILTEEENSFFSINEEDLLNFYIGKNILNFENGVFNIAGEKIRIGYEKNDNIFYLKPNKLIQYKDAHANLGGVRKVDKYNFGFKSFLGKIEFEIILTIPLSDGPKYITIKCNNNEGEICVIENNEVIEKYSKTKVLKVIDDEQ